MRMIDLPDVARYRAHVHDRPALLLLHDANDVLAEEENPAQVHVHHPLILVPPNLIEGADQNDPRVVVEHVDAAVLFHRLFDNRGDIVLGGDVAHEEVAHAAVGFYFSADLMAPIDDIDHHDGISPAGKQACGRLSDPVGGPRDQCHFF